MAHLQLGQVGGRSFQRFFTHSGDATEAGMLRRLTPLFMILSKAKADFECEDTS